MTRIGMALLATMLVGCVPKAKYEDLQDELQQCEQEARRREVAARKRLEARQALMRDLQPLIEKGVLSVEERDGRTTVGMKAQILFPAGSAELSPEGRQTVSELARVLARREGTEWQVEGHTDDTPIATAQFPSNWHLGAARAINVTEAMLAAGMSGDRISAASYGSNAPLVPNTSDENRAKNRRIEVVLLPELEIAPKGDRPARPPRPPGQRPPGQRPPPR